MKNFVHMRRHLPSASVLSASAALATASAWWYSSGTRPAAPSMLAELEATSPTSAMATSQSETATSSTSTQDCPKLIFLGTGSSTGCPSGLCSMSLHNPTPQMESLCQVSTLALQGDPKQNRNYRNNPCILIHHYDNESESYKNIIFDVGKTFRETAIRWFPKFPNVTGLDAIVLTHHHMDAAGGLDDVRSFQSYHLDYKRGGRSYPRTPVPIYLSQYCHNQLQGVFSWLFPKSSPASTPAQTTPSTSGKGETPSVVRHVASFDIKVFQDYQPFDVEGLKIHPLPVWHGDDLISHGYAFSISPGPHGRGNGQRSLNVVYISDISRMIPETLDYIQQQLPPTDILVVDALLWEKSHATHFGLEQALELRRQIQPRQHTYFVGMSCESFLPHHEMNAWLQKRHGKEVSLAHDGLSIHVQPGGNGMAHD